MDTDRLTSSTKDETVEAAVGHVLVDEQLLLLLDAAPHQADQVGVLQLGDQLDLVLELLEPLPGMRRQPLHRDLGTVRQLPLQQITSESAMSAHMPMEALEPDTKMSSARLVDGAEAAFAEPVLVGEVPGGGCQLGEVVEREL